MITINLLPDNRRPAERMPLVRFLTILVGVAGFCVEGILLYLVLAKYHDLETTVKDAKVQLKRVQAEAKKVDEIVAKKGTIAKRVEEIEKIEEGRRLWWPILWRLCDPNMLPELVWYKKMEYRTVAARKGSEERLDITACAGQPAGGGGTDMVAKWNDFVGRLREEYPRYTEHVDEVTTPFKVNPMSVKAPTDATVEPPQRMIEFNVEIRMKPMKDVLAARKKASEKGGG